MALITDTIRLAELFAAFGRAVDLGGAYHHLLLLRERGSHTAAVSHPRSWGDLNCVVTQASPCTQEPTSGVHSTPPMTIL